MNDSSYFIGTIVLFLILTIIVGTAVLFYDRAMCFRKYADFSPSWGPITGCQVLDKGKRIPVENWRSID